MTSTLCRNIGSKLLLVQHGRHLRKQQISHFSRAKKIALGTSAFVAGAGAFTALALHYSVHASEDELHTPSYPFKHKGTFTTLDTASVRRGFQVYQQVCAACHSLNYLAFRSLVGYTHTEEEAKAIAAEAQIEDGPNEKGKMFMRPGKLSDYMPKPYKNDEEARAANNGALPPDLSYIVIARHGNEDYIFSVLTGYYDPPAGVNIADGQYFNAYFPGQAISMAQALYNEIIEYEDGTPATQSQLAKDVATFLRWTSEPHHDEKKLYGFRLVLFAAMLVPLCWYLKKRTFSHIKSKKLAFKA
ncbi:cytochrome c1, heme protein, mitochondrial-like [Clavelina lepadiformis]|uniref:cytochrome c1, heme protein, mitochondrial-like n=1 Tax=Clavelina lepadiformis TaxID=159417 RepID=UPI0040413B35